VDHRVLERVPPLNPLRSEREAFRFLIWVIVVVAVLLAIVFLVRAVA
jgi:Tfp pilus assembly protein PilN